jgi:hypothetical protein
MSHVAGNYQVVKVSRRRCSTWDASLPDFHAGLCTSVIIDGKCKRKPAVVWPEGSDAEEDGDTQADTRIRRRKSSAPMSTGEQGVGAVAAPALLWTTTSTAAAMSAGSMGTGSGKHKRCEHGRERRRCKECGGSSICEHGRDRYRCMEYGGASICKHGRQRHKCMECGGSSICEHGRRWHRCKECGGSVICEHGR